MKLYVGNLPWSVDNSQLEELFSEFGSVISANVITDRDSKRSRGFGFVELESGGPEVGYFSLFIINRFTRRSKYGIIHSIS